MREGGEKETREKIKGKCSTPHLDPLESGFRIDQHFKYTSRQHRSSVDRLLWPCASLCLALSPRLLPRENENLPLGACTAISFELEKRTNDRCLALAKIDPLI